MCKESKYAAKTRPRDAEIIDVLALAFNVPRSVAAEWLLELDAHHLLDVIQNLKEKSNDKSK